MKKYKAQKLRLKYLGINTYKEAVIYLRADCDICRSEGFEAQSRLRVSKGNKYIIATLNTVSSDILPQTSDVSLSEFAWQRLGAKEGDEITLSHPDPLRSLHYIRSKIYNNILSPDEIDVIVHDISKGRLSDIHLAAFLTAGASWRLNQQEVIALTKSMIDVGEKLSWGADLIVDKHCVGGLPGNRTTLIVVPIVAAFGLMIPKTSSRAITSPAGTADTMATLAPVELGIKKIRKVVDSTGGCICWGGAISLSPADDIIIRVEKALDIDSEGQLVASILSKKVAAGSTHIVIDVPVGPTSKIRSYKAAISLKDQLEAVSEHLNIGLNVMFSDGTQPVGRGIGPALEAHDILAVLQCEDNAPQDLRNRSINIAANLIECSPDVKPGEGKQLATDILDKGLAWKKFVEICEAQGSFTTPGRAKYTHTIKASHKGKITGIDNRRLAMVAKLAGAPRSPTAGLEFFTPLDTEVSKGDKLFTIHSEYPGELRYAVDYARENSNLITIE